MGDREFKYDRKEPNYSVREQCCERLGQSRKEKAREI